MSVVLTPSRSGVRSAPEAADLAGVTYRQLDYWTRKGWIVPAELERVSAGRVIRRYGAAEILRCAALAHVGRSGLDVAAYGPRLKELELRSNEILVVGPDEDLDVIAASQLRSHLACPGRYVVFDPAPLLARLEDAEPPARDLAPTRRTA